VAHFFTEENLKRLKSAKIIGPQTFDCQWMFMRFRIKEVYEKLRGFYHWNIKKRFHIEIKVADHCNLNCIGCSHFSPIAQEHFYDVNNYKNDCKRLAELAGKYIPKIRLLGGEPLLHKDIVSIMEITRNNFGKSFIRMVTNGILLDRMPAEFWESCKKNNIIITITPYPINLNVKRIAELAHTYGVTVRNSGDSYKMEFLKFQYDINGTQNIKNTFNKCTMKRCHQLYEGKIYMCTPPTCIKYINNHFQKEFKVTANDYLDIYQIENVKVLLNYLRKPIPFCRYCNTNVKNKVLWGASKKEIEEWL